MHLEQVCYKGPERVHNNAALHAKFPTKCSKSAILMHPLCMISADQFAFLFLSSA